MNTSFPEGLKVEEYQAQGRESIRRHDTFSGGSQSRAALRAAAKRIVPADYSGSG